MMRVAITGITTLLVSVCLAGSMPREDVIDVPAVGDGLCVHNAFQSNMVIQRDKPISIWGWADKGEKVTVLFDGKEETVKAGKDRSWKVVLPALAASSEPRELVVKGKNTTLTLDNILIGDVWLLGGQSNMEFPLGSIENGALEIASANYPDIRILTVPAQNGPEPKKAFSRLQEWSGWFSRHFRKGYWDVCTPETARELSGIGYVFARRIHMAAKIPIGVIDVSRGGTTVETWTPAPVLRKMDTKEVQAVIEEWEQKIADYDPQKDLEKRVERYNSWVEKMKKEGKEIPADRKKPTDLLPGPAANQNRPGNCYASMMEPIAGLQVKGAIWHQGYNNCFSGTAGAIMYRQVFPEMIKAWRSAFNNPDMAFGIISLCTQGTPQTRDDFCSQMLDAGPYIREAQYETFLELFRKGDKNIGFTSTYDLRRRWYHPQLKVPAGERIARWALASQYGFEKQVRWKPPMIEKMKVEDGRVLLYMDENAAAVDDGGPMVGFAIAGEDRKFHPADIDHFIKGKDDRGRPQKDMKILVLSSPMVPEPVHYRYAWARSPLANIQAHHNTDIPMATQRSDDWPLENVPLGVLGDEQSEKIDRGQRGKIAKALRGLDIERRLKKAELFISENSPDRKESRK